MAIVGDAFAKPILRALDANPGRWDLSSLLHHRLVGRDVERGRRSRGCSRHNPRHDAGRRVRLVGGDRHGPVDLDRGRRRRRRPSSRSAPNARVIDDDGTRRRARLGEIGPRGRPRRTMPVGYYKDPEQVGGDVRHHRRRALLDARRLGHGRGRRHDHAARARLVCINTGGEKVFPEEVEEVLKTHPTVADAVVVGVPDEKLRRGDHRAWSSRSRATTVDEDELIAHVKAQLAALQGPQARARRRHHRPRRPTARSTTSASSSTPATSSASDPPLPRSLRRRGSG